MSYRGKGGRFGGRKNQKEIQGLLLVNVSGVVMFISIAIFFTMMTTILETLGLLRRARKG